MNRRRFLALLAAVPLLRYRGQATTVAEYCLRPVDTELLTLINNYRSANGVKALVPDQRLGAAAEHHALDMALTWTFSHTQSDGTTWYQNLTNHGYTVTPRGENLAWGYTSAQRTFDAWKGSPGHNANMLNASYGAIGLSLVINGEGDSHEEWAWANTFGPYVVEPVVTCGGGVTPTVVATSTPRPTNTPAPVTPTATHEVKICRGNNSRWCR
jgi:uncharacterized protein YkwD